MRYSLSEFSVAIGAKLFERAQQPITHVAIDSRSVTAATGLAFFALVGERFDGHQFIDELYTNSGVRIFVVSNRAVIEHHSDATFLLVPDTLVALQQLAAYHRGKFNCTVVGVTGSNGKTIVKEWLSQLTSPDKRVVRSPKSFNSQVGVPLSVLQLEDDSELGIFEAGISKPNEMQKLETILRPNIGIITNVGTAHQENFQSLEMKCSEKLKLFKHSQVIVFCTDHVLVEGQVRTLGQEHGIKLFGWGHGANSTLRVLGRESSNMSTSFELEYKGERQKLFIPFADAASFENAMHCIAAMLHMGTSLSTIAQRIGDIQPVAMRLELKEGRNGCTIINDSYNSDLGSLSVALDFMAQMGHSSSRIVILSDILQSGRDPSELYAEVAKLLKEKNISLVIGVGKEITLFQHYFEVRFIPFETTQSLLSNFPFGIFSNATVLVKGSRIFEFERISAILEQKTHRTYLEINLNTLVHNLNYFRSLLNPNVKIMAMVKAFSYGSGSFEIANLLQFQRVDYLAVAFADEGVALREAGIRLPIVVLNPAFGSYETMIAHQLQPEIFSFASLRSFSGAAKKMGTSNYPVHIKLNTGMHRLGFNTNEIEQLIGELNDNPQIKVDSILSHMVAADEIQHDDFSHAQIDQFKTMSERVQRGIGYRAMLHILNSAGIERFPQAQFDMVRLGIGLYGISSVRNHQVETVSSLVTFVAQLHKVASGDTVGYNRKGKVQRDSVIATIPIGYADGLNRRLGNGVGKMLVGGQLAPIVGNICMDTCMLDVTGLAVEEGDEVVVFGHLPSITDIANWLETIPYEVLTSISRRVKRVYIQE